jgi:hypothetical protein
MNSRSHKRTQGRREKRKKQRALEREIDDDADYYIHHYEKDFREYKDRIWAKLESDEIKHKEEIRRKIHEGDRATILYLLFEGELEYYLGPIS